MKLRFILYVALTVMLGLVVGALSGYSEGNDSDVPVTQIIIDGQPDDWSEYRILKYDQNGDISKGGFDLKSVRAFTNDQYLYLMIEAYGDIGEYVQIDVDIDVNGDGNQDYMATFQPRTGRRDFGDFTSGQRNWESMEGGSAAEGKVVEFKMPIGLIGLCESFTLMNIRVMNGTCCGEQWYTVDNMGPAYVARSNEIERSLASYSVIVDGSPAIWQACGVAFDPEAHIAWITEETPEDGRLVRLDLVSGAVTSLITALNCPRHLVISGTSAFVAGDVVSPERLVRIDLNNGTLTPVSNPLGDGLSGVAVNRALTRAYVVNYRTGALSQVDIDRSSPTFKRVTPLVTELVSPRDISIDCSETTAYVTERDAGRLVSVDIDPDSASYGDVVPVANGLGAPMGLTLNRAENCAYLADEQGRRLVAVDLDPFSARYGKVTTIIDHQTLQDVVLLPGERTALVTDAEDGPLLINIDPGSPTYGHILKILTPRALYGPRGLVLGSEDKVAYVVCEYSDKLYRVNVDPTSSHLGTVEPIATIPFIPTDIAVNSAETLAYVVSEQVPDYGQNVLTRVDLRTGRTTTVTDRLGHPSNIVLSSDETQAYVVNLHGDLYRVHLRSGEITTVATGLSEPFAVAVNRAELRAYVVTVPAGSDNYPKGDLLEIDLQTGQVSTLIDDEIQGASGIVINADETLAYLTEFGPEGRCGGSLSVVDIDPASPTYGTLTRLLTGLCGAHDVRLTANESVAYVTELDSHRLIRVEL